MKALLSPNSSSSMCNYGLVTIYKQNQLVINSNNKENFTHNFIKFPGKFPPTLCEWAIKKYSNGGMVLDPLCGVGTVLLESFLQKKMSVGIDIDPLSTFISKVKTTPLDPIELREHEDKLLAELKTYYRKKEEIKIRMFKDIANEEFNRKQKMFSIPNFKNQTHWFRKYVLVDLATIKHFINVMFEDENLLPAKNFFLGNLASIIRLSSLADKSTVSGLEVTKIMNERIKKGYEIDVFALFKKKLSANINQMSKLFYKVKSFYKDGYLPKVMCGNINNLNYILTKHNIGQIKLVMTSPPYCTAIEYWRRHRLEYFWLDFFQDSQDIREFSRYFLGSESALKNSLENLDSKNLDSKKLNALLNLLSKNNINFKKIKIIEKFFIDTYNYLNNIFDFIEENGIFILVVGNNKLNGFKIPTDEIIIEMSDKIGYKLNNVFKYNIKNRVMQYPTKYTDKIKSEKVIILKK